MEGTARTNPLPKPTIESIKERILPILVSYGATRAGVFGSMARGEMTADSDIDILVQLGPDLSLLDVVRLNREIEEAIGRGVDLVEYDCLKPRIKDKVLSEEIRIL
jgi:predicted nucleotidyltransferase